MRIHIMSVIKFFLVSALNANVGAQHERQKQHDNDENDGEPGWEGG